MDENQLIQALASALAPHLGLAKADGTPISTYAYSEGGLFGSCKQDPVLINAMVNPTGYMAKLQWQGTATENPIVQSLTCINSSGYDQTSSCADCGHPYIYRCAQSACFGRICQQTDEVLFDELGLMANNNVSQLALYGNITDPSGRVLVRQGTAVTDMFTLHVVAAAYNLRRRIGQLLWVGNPGANAGGYAEFPGFDLLINTGYQDALTGIDCAAMDSFVMNYGLNVVGAAGSPSILAYISRSVREVRYRIEGAGFSTDGAIIDIVMHPDIWDCVADAAACEYGLQCGSWASTTAQMSNDALAVAEIRDRMKNGMYLTIDGRNYPVTLDNGIAVVNRPIGNETGRTSTIYVITRSIPGAPPVPDSPGGGIVTYGEYQDMQRTAGNVIGWFNQMFGSKNVAVTDGGRFAVAPTSSGGYCFDVKVLTKPRVRMLMPWTSARITSVICIPLQQPYPEVTGSGGVYDLCSGASTTPENYLYGDCWPTHVGGSYPRQ